MDCYAVEGEEYTRTPLRVAYQRQPTIQMPVIVLFCKSVPLVTCLDVRTLLPTIRQTAHC
jgi:hypothetical protein